MSADEQTPEIQAAKRIVEDEIGIITSERDAFDDFRKRIGGGSSFEPTLPRSLDGTAISDRLVVNNGFVDAYRKTVMATDHYETDYGNDPLEDIRIEFGDDIIGLLRRTSAPNPIAVRVLDRAATASIHRRERVLELLDAEREVLKEMGREIEFIHAALDEATPSTSGASRASSDRTDRSVIERLERRCDEIVSQRQDMLNDSRRDIELASGSTVQVDEYLYEPLDSSHPILFDLANLGSQLHEVRRRLVDRSRCGVEP